MPQVITNPTIKGKIMLEEEATNELAANLTTLAAGSLYFKGDKFVIAYNNAGTMTYITIPLDGSTTTWTHSTSAP